MAHARRISAIDFCKQSSLVSRDDDDDDDDDDDEIAYFSVH